MITNSKPTVSRTAMKIVLAIAIAAGLLAILSGVLFSLDREINVQSRVAPVNNRQSFASLPEYGYIQAHQAKVVQPVKAAAVTGFQALPEYGYIRAHSFGISQEAYLPAGMRSLAEFDYIQAHNQVSTAGGTTFLAATLPQGMRAMPVFGYIEAHSRPGVETFVAGLPNGLQALPEAGYIQMHTAGK